MSIEKATIQDVQSLEILINSAYRGEYSKKGWTTEANLLSGKRINREELQRIIQQPDVTILKFTDDDNKIKGCVYLKKNDNKMYLGMLSVSPELQSQGMGKKILLASEEFAKKNNCDVMEMRVFSVRHELLAWYQKQGYTATGEKIPYDPAPEINISDQPLEFLMLEKLLAHI